METSWFVSTYGLIPGWEPYHGESQNAGRGPLKLAGG